jgi:hypothetical protein
VCGERVCTWLCWLACVYVVRLVSVCVVSMSMYACNVLLFVTFGSDKPFDAYNVSCHACTYNPLSRPSNPIFVRKHFCSFVKFLHRAANFSGIQMF